MTEETAVQFPEESGAGILLIESFSRVLCLMSFDPVAFQSAVAALDASSSARGEPLGDTTSHKTRWTSLDPTFVADQARFCLKPVQRYLFDHMGGTCAVRSLNIPNPYRNLIGARQNELASIREVPGTAIPSAGFDVSLNAAELYLFSTGIGVLGFEFCLGGIYDNGQTRSPTLRDLTEFNYFLNRTEPHQAIRLRDRWLPPPVATQQQLSPGSATPFVARRSDSVREALRKTPGIGIADLAQLVLSSLTQAGIDYTFVSDRAYPVQTFARVKSQRDIEESAQLSSPLRIDSLAPEFFRLRRMLKSSYQAPADQLLSDDPEVVRTFENVVVGVSLEGFAALVVDNDHPFFAQIAHRFRRSYFAHYLLALHQRAALMGIADAARRLPYLRTGTLDRETVNQVREVRYGAMDFTLHHRFSQAGTITPYAQVYERMIAVLGIEPLLEEIRDELRELDEILRDHVQQSEELARERAARRDRDLNYLVAAFAVLALLFGLFGVNLPPYGAPPNTNPEGLRFYLRPLASVPAACALLLLAILGFFYWRHHWTPPGATTRRTERK